MGVAHCGNGRSVRSVRQVATASIGRLTYSAARRPRKRRLDARRSLIKLPTTKLSSLIPSVLAFSLSQDTRHGRITLCESEQIDKMVEAVTNYIAQRLIEREQVLAAAVRGGIPRERDKS